MKQVKFKYRLGGSIDLVVKADVHSDGNTLIREVYDADTCRPFDMQWILIQASAPPFRSIPLIELFINMAVEEASEDV